jgi:pimeloyl-ACP methyl ester carboxylesterase/DNA-binding CsgD family transcriptional regulator
MEPPLVHYVETDDSMKIGYTVNGSGPTLVYMPFSISNVGRVSEGDWGQNPQFSRLVSQVRLVRYDHRGQGVSTRGLGAAHCLEDYERDLDAVLGRLMPERVILMGGALSSHVAVRYAARHPERLRGLVLYRTGVTLRASPTLNQDLAAGDWELFLHSLLAVVHANESLGPGERRQAVANMKTSVTQADWLAYARVAEESNVEEFLSGIQTPALVLATGGHLTISRQDATRLASLIPNARLVMVDESAALGATAEPVLDFVRTLDAPPAGSFEATAAAGLSTREVEVLRLIARGKSNPQIAAALVISVNTVVHHVSSILNKAGLANRTEAAAYAERMHLV